MTTVEQTEKLTYKLTSDDLNIPTIYVYLDVFDLPRFRFHYDDKIPFSIPTKSMGALLEILKEVETVSALF
jgi:hypothetical protein